jgi:hypothetical protein
MTTVIIALIGVSKIFLETKDKENLNKIWWWVFCEG